MNLFPDQLILRALSCREIEALGSSRVPLWEIEEPFSYLSDRLKGIVIVPAGMITDFASIPQVLWSHLSPDDPRILFPSVVHDYLYSMKGELPDGRIYSREDADAVLREAMEECDADSFLREAVYDAVRAGGASHWDATLSEPITQPT